MIDHFNLPVPDVAKGAAFYDAVLAPLGMQRLVDTADAVGFGQSTWVFGVVAAEGPVHALHCCFVAPSRAAVGAFHRAGLASGAACNGEPGLRPTYGADYFAAYLIAPGGHRIEAVYRETSQKPVSMGDTAG